VVQCSLALSLVLPTFGAGPNNVIRGDRITAPTHPARRQEALRKMTVPEGFKVELVASERGHRESHRDEFR